MSYILFCLEEEDSFVDEIADHIAADDSFEMIHLLSEMRSLG